MNYNEKMLIASVYSEDTYKEVSFLEPKDFTNLSYTFFWELLQKHEGDVIKALNSLDIKANKQLSKEIFTYSNLLGCNNYIRIALMLVENRFKSLLSVLLSDLSINSKNALEVNLLNECISAITKHDIFQLSDGLLEYLGHQASDHTKKRITDYLQYMDKRIEEIKEVRNGIR
jgi:hypothetical protein